MPKCSAHCTSLPGSQSPCLVLFPPLRGATGQQGMQRREEKTKSRAGAPFKSCSVTQLPKPDNQSPISNLQFPIPNPLCIIQSSLLNNLDRKTTPLSVPIPIGCCTYSTSDHQQSPCLFCLFLLCKLPNLNYYPNILSLSLLSLLLSQ